MRISYLKFVLPILIISSCKQENKDEGEKYFPVLSFIQSQVAHVDTSLYNIRKYVTVDTLKTDTFYIPREQFRQLAADFLNIPDLADPSYKKRFREEKTFDETLNSALLVYLPVNPEKELLQRQEVLIKPNPSGDKITNIIINLSKDNRDSSIQKKMLWKVDESFQVITTKQYKGQPETLIQEKVIWGEDE